MEKLMTTGFELIKPQKISVYQLHFKIAEEIGIGRHDKCKSLMTKSMGRGTYGRIYLSDNNTILKFVRVVRDECIDGVIVSKLELATFREICVYKTLPEHPNVAKFFGAYVHSQFHLLLEIENCGTSLYHPSEFWRGVDRKHLDHIIDGMIASIKFCHHHEIAHNDINPSNFVWNGVDVKLIDFGLARKFSGEICVEMIGNVMYRAPELLDLPSHEKATGEKLRESDLWSLGLSIYQLITCKNYSARIPPNMQNILIVDYSFSDANSHRHILDKLMIERTFP